MDETTTPKLGSLIVVATYCEAENLEPLVREILACDVGFEVLVVDDASPDGTGEIADRLARESRRVHVLHRPGKLGYGTAVAQGFGWALARGYAYVLQMDADFSHAPRELPKFLERIADHDLVVGSRYVAGGGTRNWGLFRRLLSRSANLVARRALGLPLADATGGFRCYRREILAGMTFRELRGYAFLVAAALDVHRRGGRIAEFPIMFEDRRVGRSKMSLGIIFEAVGYVLRAALGRA